MNDREKFIMRAALIYLQANRDDVNEAFFQEYMRDDGSFDIYEALSVNGEQGELIKEDEVGNLLMTLQ